MPEPFDIIIAGGGPAGSSTANFLRQRGRRVVVLERERFPRFHIGESLLPFTNDLWRELGVLDTLDATCIHKPGARFVHEESGAEFTYYFDQAIRPGRPYAFQVKRADFDKMLLDRARAVGAEVREATRVEEVRFGADRVEVRCREPGGNAYQLSAPMFIDATGRDALLGSRLQLKIPDELVTTNAAVHSMYKNVPRSSGRDAGNIIIGLFDGGWWWVIPFLDGDTSVGMVLEKQFTKVRRGSSPDEMMDAALAHLPHLSRLLAGATRFLPVGAQANWSYRCRCLYGDRFLLVGDAAAFVDPLFSTGVLLAVNCAKFAAAHADAALADGDFSAERFAAYQAQCLSGMELFKRLVHEFYAENLRQVLLASKDHATMRAIITSMLAGDVYQPALWHGAIKKPGFSRGIA